MKKIKLNDNQKRRVRMLLSALKSGKYRQTKNELKSEDGCFCVHGLMCEVYRKAKRRPENYWNENHRIFVAESRKEKQYSGIYAQPMVVDYFGLDKLGPMLANMNDNGYSFQRLAKYIENKVEL